MDPLDHVRIVLVRPRGAANVGAAARAMKNSGLGDLVLVAPRTGPASLARVMAVHAADVLERSRTVDTLAEAVSDCALVVGTTARTGFYRTGARDPRSLVPEIVARARDGRAALVFGPEDHGLSGEELEVCHRLIRIPTSPAYSSLNLAQAVMLCAHELFLAAGACRDEPPAPDFEAASSARVEQVHERLRSALLRIGFLPEDNPDHIMRALRRLLGRAGLEEREARILLGLARQIEWYAEGGWREAERRRDAGRKLK